MLKQNACMYMFAIVAYSHVYNMRAREYWCLLRCSCDNFIPRGNIDRGGCCEGQEIDISASYIDTAQCSGARAR